MLSPSDFIVDTWPRASQYLHHFFCLFILFMLHFFYLVNHQHLYALMLYTGEKPWIEFVSTWNKSILNGTIPKPTIFLTKIFSRVFSSPSWSEWNMKPQWTQLQISSTGRIFTDLISVEVKERNQTNLGSRYRVQVGLSKNSSPLQQILSIWKLLKWLRMRNMGKKEMDNFLFVF